MRKFIVIISAALFAFSCSTSSYEINGEINNGLDQMVYLKTLNNNALELVDSTFMKDGKFQFKGNVNVPHLNVLEFSFTNERIIFFIENSKITIEGDVSSIPASTIKGSKSQDLMVKFNEIQEVLAQPLMAIQTEFQTAFQEGTLTPELEEEIRGRYMEESKKLQQAAIDFVRGNPKSVVSAYITLTQLANQIEDEILEEIVEGLKDLKESPFVEALLEKVEVTRKTAIGQDFMDFTHPDKDNNDITFSSVTGKNYVLLDFWAAWCAPCRQENPNLVNLYNKYNEKGFDIFGVSLDRSFEEWQDAIENDGLTWSHVSNLTGWENPIAKMYGVQSIPSNLLISPEGKIIARNLRGSELADKLAELLD